MFRFMWQDDDYYDLNDCRGLLLCDKIISKKFLSNVLPLSNCAGPSMNFMVGCKLFKTFLKYNPMKNANVKNCCPYIFKIIFY